MTLKTTVLACLLSCGLMAAPKPRDWKTGTLEETVRTSASTQGPHVMVMGPGTQAAAAAMASQPRTKVVQGYRIEGNGYSFMVACDIIRGKVPNVTVHGPIKYAITDGTFYLLDEDGREFKATVLEKALLPPPVPPAPPAKP